MLTASGAYRVAAAAASPPPSPRGRGFSSLVACGDLVVLRASSRNALQRTVLPRGRAASADHHEGLLAPRRARAVTPGTQNTATAKDLPWTGPRGGSTRGGNVAPTTSSLPLPLVLGLLAACLPPARRADARPRKPSDSRE